MFEQIKPMVGAEHDVNDYVVRIPYHWNSDLLITDDPFDLDALMQPLSDRDYGEDFLVRSQSYDHLLFWLSAVGSGSRDIFRRTCQAIGLDTNGIESRHAFRRLRLLGHVESSPNGYRWSVAPSALARIDLSDGGGEFFLCGQRDTGMLQNLRQIAEVEEQPQITGDAPAIVRIRADDEEEFRIRLQKASSLSQLSIEGDVAYRLAQLVPTLTGWVNILEVLDGILPHMFEVKRFHGHTFVDEPFEGKSGFYELWPLEGDRDGTTRPKYVLFYDSASQRWIRGDWYGLRFLARQLEGDLCPARYDAASGRLAIPDAWRWPELYERVLVLASGQLPYRNGLWLIYEAISTQTFDQLRVKLNLQCEENPADA
ncbi:MAG TPA: hypothetical protein VFV38_33550 [Ktedonobacteraceae bacterium]|nr:hypothetical protein [Ktedonobacteraceae bacterium]